MGKWDYKGKGVCSVCEGPYIFRDDGKLRRHDHYVDGKGNREECPGWELPPKEVK